MQALRGVFGEMFLGQKNVRSSCYGHGFMNMVTSTVRQPKLLHPCATHWLFWERLESQAYSNRKALIEHLLGRGAVGNWIQVPALPRDGCVTLGQLMHLSGLQFLLL